MSERIREAVRVCTVCASTLPSLPMEKLYVDYIGLFPRSGRGNVNALVIIVAFSKFVWIQAVWNATTDTTIRDSSRQGFFVFWTTTGDVSDNAKQFTSHVFVKLFFTRSKARHDFTIYAKN